MLSLMSKLLSPFTRSYLVTYWNKYGATHSQAYVAALTHNGAKRKAHALRPFDYANSTVES